MPSIPTAHVAPTWRRLLRFSLRGLIIFILVFGLWLGWQVRSAHIQRDALAAITNAYGNASYNWQKNGAFDIPDAKPWAPQWLVDRIGVDYFGHVVSVSLPDKPDAVCEHVGRLSRLERLSFGYSQLGDTGLAHLRGLTELTCLDLSGTNVTDAGLANLKEMTTLKCIDLSHTQVSDAGLAHLNGLTGLTELELNETRVSDSGLAHLKGLRQLSIVGLLRAPVTDAGVAHLAALPNLERLNLRYTDHTDAAIPFLKSLKKLIYIGLSDKVTDAGVKDLQCAKPNVEKDY